MVVVDALARAQLRQALESASPFESCGLMLGRFHGNDSVVTEILVLANVHPTPARAFRLDPVELVAAHARADQLGLGVLGVWHSHPRGPLTPSNADRMGVQEGWLHLIVAPTPRGMRMRFYKAGARPCAPDEARRPEEGDVGNE